MQNLDKKPLSLWAKDNENFEPTPTRYLLENIKRILRFWMNYTFFFVKLKKKTQYNSVEIKEILSHTFSHKNFVKATFFIDKILKSGFHEIFFREREFLVFPHGNSLSHLYFFGKNFVKVSVIDRLLKRWFHGFFLVWENFSLDEIFARKSWKWNSIIPHIIVNFRFSCKISVKLSLAILKINWLHDIFFHSWYICTFTHLVGLK